MIIHVDMDAFFASVEQLDNPDLAGKPVAVGGSSDRGVVSTASYEARVYGVRSAMSVVKAKKLCPDLILVPGRRQRYVDISRRVMAVFDSVSPVVEQVSIDEAYIDVTGCEKIFGPPYKIGENIKKKIFHEVGLTCSVGIAPLKFLAKIASDMNKPDGITMITPAEVKGFIESLEVGKVPGVGKKTGEILKKMNLRTMGDVRRYPPAQLERRLGKYGLRLMELSRGVDSSGLGQPVKSKSVSTETTLERDTWDREVLGRYLLGQSQEVGRELRKSGYKAKTVVLKIKHEDFTQVTRSMTLSAPTSSSESLYRGVVELFEKYQLTRKVRLIGVGASGLLPEGTRVQKDLFGNPEGSPGEWEKVEKALDSIAERFGKKAVVRASLKGSEG